MNLTEQLLHEIADPTLSHDERAQVRCRLAKSAEEAGDYEGSRDALGELWQGVGKRPFLDGLTKATAAEVLMRVGVVSGWIGSGRQVAGAQESAKNLISESITIFESLRDQVRAAEAQTELACCYWREGAFDEARIMLNAALSPLTDDTHQKATTLLRCAMLENSATRFNDSIRILTEATPLFEASSNDCLKGRFHNTLALALRSLGTRERREDYIDRALVEYTAASFHFEQAGHERYRARVENNLGFLFSTIGKFSEAHTHANRARRIFAKLKDSGSVAQVDDTRARIFLAEGRNAEAERAVRSAVRTLEKGGEQSLLAEALTSHGVAQARMGFQEQAQASLRRAMQVAEQAGDRESAGLAALTLIEEMREPPATSDTSALFERAAELLANSQHPGVPARLNACASRLLRLFAHPSAKEVPENTQSEDSSESTDWEDFSFRRAVRRYERRLIERALQDAGGQVTQAAQLLGFKHHQSLIWLLNSRHKTLLQARSPVVPRKRSIFRGSRPSSNRKIEKSARPVTILHIEDNQAVADATREALEYEGWKVETYKDGTTALQKLAGNTPYDLLLLDNDLPGIKGLELVTLARKLPHRRRAPIVMFSASNCETDAWRAGVDAFLRKPEDITAVAEIVARLLSQAKSP